MQKMGNKSTAGTGGVLTTDGLRLVTAQRSPRAGNAAVTRGHRAGRGAAALGTPNGFAARGWRRHGVPRHQTPSVLPQPRLSPGRIGAGPPCSPSQRSAAAAAAPPPPGQPAAPRAPGSSCQPLRSPAPPGLTSHPRTPPCPSPPPSPIPQRSPRRPPPPPAYIREAEPTWPPPPRSPAPVPPPVPVTTTARRGFSISAPTRPAAAPH